MADADPATPPVAATSPGATPRAGARRRLFTIFGAILLVVALAAAGWWLVFAQNRVSTDNAYVGADSAQVTALVAAAVLTAPVRETQFVRAGDVVATLDAADAQLAVAQAEAQFGTAMRRVSGYFANGDALQAQIASRAADIAAADARVASARADLARAKVDLDRRQALIASGAVSGDELTNARNRHAAALAALDSALASKAQAAAQVVAARGNKAINTALIAGNPIERNPEVRAARAALEKARLDLQRSVVRAPVSGIVTRKTVQIGQRVAPGSALMTIVPVETAYVDANFKEGQLRRVRAGQKATLTSDLYGGDIVYHGRVIGLSGGTGSAFALIPAQNATGNWIKVVQRLPVRIALDPAELRAHPLRIGLSMSVDIDVSNAR